MHFVGPRRRLQFEPAHHGHHFLPIRHPHPRLRRRHRHRCHKILFRQECPAQITIHSCGILNARPVSRPAGLAVLCFVAHAVLAVIQRSGATKNLSSIAALTQPIAVKTALLFRPTIRTNVHILPNPHFPRPNLRLRMKAKPLPIHHKSHVRPDLPIRPRTERFLHDQIPHAIISFDQLRHFRRRLRRCHILLGLRRRREKPYPRHVLRQHRHQRQTERLVNIRREFIARQILERTAIRQFLLERYMPVLIPLVPPQILQPAPELVRLLDPPHFLPPRRFRFHRILLHQPPQRHLQTFRQLLVIAAGRILPRIPTRGHSRRHRAFDRHKRRICLRDGFLNGHSLLAF